MYVFTRQDLLFCEIDSKSCELSHAWFRYHELFFICSCCFFYFTRRSTTSPGSFYSIMVTRRERIEWWLAKKLVLHAGRSLAHHVLEQVKADDACRSRHRDQRRDDRLDDNSWSRLRGRTNSPPRARAELKASLPTRISSCCWHQASPPLNNTPLPTYHKTTRTVQMVLDAAEHAVCILAAHYGVPTGKPLVDLVSRNALAESTHILSKLFQLDHHCLCHDLTALRVVLCDDRAMLHTLHRSRGFHALSPVRKREHHVAAVESYQSQLAKFSYITQTIAPLAHATDQISSLAHACVAARGMNVPVCDRVRTLAHLEATTHNHMHTAFTATRSLPARSNRYH
jgi:hypothetical protein